MLSEDGPAHERRYAIRCKLTSPEHTIVTEAQGSSKKAAKQNACSEMLTRLKRLETTPIYMAQSLMKTTTPIAKQKVAVSKENKRKTIVKVGNSLMYKHISGHENGSLLWSTD